MKDFIPSQDILQKYAQVLVNFALGSGKGIKKGDVVRLAASESAKPFYMELRKAILRSGGHILGQYIPEDDETYKPSRDYYELASDEQLKFFPKAYIKGIVSQIDHSISVVSEVDKHVLEGIDPKKIMTVGLTMKPFMDWITEKENRGGNLPGQWLCMAHLKWQKKSG